MSFMFDIQNKYIEGEGNDPGNSSGAQHRKYGSTEKCQERDPKPTE